MANNDKITIEVKQVLDTAKDSKQLFESFKSFKNDNNKKDFEKAKASLSKMEAYSQVKDFSKESLKEFRKSFNDFVKSMFAIASTNVKADEKLTKLYERDRILREKINKEEELKNKERSKITVRKNGDVVPSNSRDIMRENGGVYRATGRVDEKGNQIISKVMEVNFSNVLKKMDEGFKYFDVKGNPIENIGWWQDLTKIGPNAVKAIKEHEENIENTSKELQELQSEIDNLEKNTEELSGDFSALKNVAALQGKGSKVINEQFSKYEEKANAGRAEEYEKDYQKSLDTDKIFTKQTSSIAAALKSFSIYAVTLKLVKKAANEAKRAILELDRAITQQAMVTGKSREEIKKLVPLYSELASATGSTTKEVAGIATQFLRQGKTVKQTLELTEAAISAAKVAGVSAAESVNFLTTALNGFQLSAKDAMSVSDKFAAVASSSATSYEELATALSKVASQANMAGMSIDYTTALLAKGVETTREAPETIGTALKTVIARMRELTDYGATLEDGININNVERQLAYVQIALRDTNGELRSTEDVLNDLGGKWETLSANQQAAIAKALAGTRQQSRLIAMMTDYKRVIELQEIAQESSGATAIQMNDYMEGLDASLNRITQSWNSFIEALNNNSTINNIVEGIADVAEFLAENWKTIGLILAGILADHLLMNSYQKIKNFLMDEEVKKANKKKKLELESVKNQKKINLDKQKAYVTSLKDLKVALEKKQAESKITVQEQKRLSLLDEEIQKEEAKVVKAEEEYKLADQELATFTELNDTKTIGQKITEKISQTSAIISLISTTIAGIQKLITREKKKQNTELVKQQANEAAVTTQDTTQAVAATAKATAEQQYHAAGAALAILAVAGIAGIVGLTSLLGGSDDDDENAVKNINSAYKLKKEADTLKSILAEVKQINDKIVVTNSDNEKLKELWNQVGEKLTDKEKDDFNNITSEEKKIEFLEKKIKKIEEDAKTAAKNVLSSPQTVAKTEWRWEKTTLNNKTTTWYVPYTVYEDVFDKEKAKQALKTLVNFNKALSEEEKRILGLYLDYIPEQDLRKLAKETNPEKQLLNTLEEWKENGILPKEGLTGYNKLSSAKTVNDELKKEQYSQWEKKVFNEYYDGILNNQDVLKFVDISDFLENKQQITFDELSEMLNKGTEAKELFGWSNENFKENWSQLLFDFFNELKNNPDSTIYNVWHDILDTRGYLKEDSGIDQNKIWTLLSNTMATKEEDLNTFTAKIQNYNNELKGIWDKFFDWNNLSETEQKSFLEDYFPNNDKVLKYLNAQDYNHFSEALVTVMQGKNEELIEELDKQIQILEMTEDTDKATLALLRGYKEKLENIVNSNYLLDLSKVVEQEQQQLSKFKEYLQKRNQVLIDALEERKEAYQKYFEEINLIKEDEDFEEQATLLQSNLAKLQGSYGETNAKRMELEKQLEDLEKQRLETLRQRAQEQLIQNIDDQIEQANEFLDDIEKDSAMALVYLRSLLKDDSFYQDFMKITTEGMTENQRKLAAQEFNETYHTDTSIEEQTNNYNINVDIDSIEEKMNILENIANAMGITL